jgi:hypothetical protein
LRLISDVVARMRVTISIGRDYHSDPVSVPVSVSVPDVPTAETLTEGQWC